MNGSDLFPRKKECKKKPTFDENGNEMQQTICEYKIKMLIYITLHYTCNQVVHILRIFVIFYEIDLTIFSIDTKKKRKMKKVVKKENFCLREIQLQMRKKDNKLNKSKDIYIYYYIGNIYEKGSSAIAPLFMSLCFVITKFHTKKKTRKLHNNKKYAKRKILSNCCYSFVEVNGCVLTGKKKLHQNCR